MKIGIIIKQLRVNKKILSKNLYHNLLTRVAIVKFEKGESDTSSEKFLEILDRLSLILLWRNFTISILKRRKKMSVKYRQVNIWSLFIIEM